MILITSAFSLFIRTTISTALAFRGSQASAFGYFAKVFQLLFLELYCSSSLRVMHVVDL